MIVPTAAESIASTTIVAPVVAAVAIAFATPILIGTAAVAVATLLVLLHYSYC